MKGKISVLVLATLVLISLSLLPLSEIDAADTELTISTSSISSNNSAYVTLSIQNNPGISTYSIDIVFDEGLSLQKITVGDVFSEDSMAISEVIDNKFRIAGFSLSGKQTSGIIATMLFSVENTKETDYKVVISDSELETLSGESVKHNTVNGSIHVEKETKPPYEPEESSIPENEGSDDDGGWCNFSFITLAIALPALLIIPLVQTLKR